MAKATVRRRGKVQEHLHVSFSKMNYYILGAGIALIIIGYICMSERTVDGYLPTVVAPILLFLGYCIVIPIGILYKAKGEALVGEEIASETAAEPISVKKSNIKTK